MTAFADAWKVADKDTDGSISLAEFAAMERVKSLPEANRAKLFERLDKNGDAKLSREEIHRGAERRHDGQRPPMKRLWELDADQSGGISLEEFKAGQVFKKLAPEKQGVVFKRLDTNGDGMITPKDRPLKPGKRGEGSPEQRPYRISDKLDLNRDGALSFEEFRAGPAVRDLTEDAQETRFERLDRNKDQRISPTDFYPAPPTVEKE